MLSCVHVCAKCNLWVRHPLRIFVNLLYELYFYTRQIVFIFVMQDYLSFYTFASDVAQQEPLDLGT